MTTPDRAETRSAKPEVIAQLDVKNREREAILDDTLVSRIGTLLGITEPAAVDNGPFFRSWRLSLRSGMVVTFDSYPIRWGRVSSGDIPAYDCVRVRYSQARHFAGGDITSKPFEANGNAGAEGELDKTANMRGVSRIQVVRGANGVEVVQFVQVTDKMSSKVSLSAEKIGIDGHSNSNRNIPPFFVRNFDFRVI